MGAVIKIVGTGPGDPRHITPAALEAIQAAQVVVGGRRLLDSFARPEQERCIIDKDLPAVVEFIQKQPQGKKVAVLVSGDPGFFSMAQYLKKRLQGLQLEFIPGISSVQYMFARLQLPWQQVPFYSLHGRSMDKLPQWVKTAPAVALLTGGEWSVQAIAAYLLNQQVKARVSIGINLSYPHEQVVHTTLEVLAEDGADYSNSVMVIFNENAF
ncbi:MAG: precorrin-6y C5,15-methyltransferase (decarboxylating) subunit CbiE [Syntrophomonadaceae bacterium]